jgi:CHAT domain-containing protein/predicted negative regulator of RcsB-dependent stress response
MTRGLSANGAVQDPDIPLLSLHQPIQRELAQGESHPYHIACESGQYLRTRINPSSIDVGVTLQGPNGQKLIELRCLQNRPKLASLVAEASGIYRLEIRSLAREATTGRYEVSIEEIRPATTEDKSRIAAERAFAEGDQLRAEWKAESSRKAIEKYKEAWRSWQAVGDQREVVTALKTIGEICQLLGEPQRALAHYNHALQLSQDMNDPRLQGEILNQIGNVYVDSGENQKALDYCTRALTISQTVNNQWGEAQALDNLGEVYHALGNDRKALHYYQQSLSLWRALGDRRGEAQTLWYLGSNHSAFGLAPQAFDAYRQALSLWRAVNDQRGEALTLIALGHLHSRLGEKQEALNHYEQAMPLIQTMADQLWQASILSGMGSVYLSLGYQDRALKSYTQALRHYQAVSYRHGEANSLISLGRIYFSRGEPQEAIRHYQRALAIGRSMADKSVEAFARSNLARVFDALGRTQKTLQEHQWVLAFYREEKSLLGEAQTLHNLGDLYERGGQKEKSLTHFADALTFYRLVGDRFGEAATLYRLARAERDRGNLPQARSHMEVALPLVEDLRARVTSQELRTSYFATVQQNYELYIDLLMQLHKQHPSDELVATALQVSESARARSLLDMLAEARADIRQGVDPALLDRERALRQQLDAREQARTQLLMGKHTPEQAAEAEAELDELHQQYEDARAQIRAKSPRFAALTQSQPLSVKQIQHDVLDSDTLLLEYALGDERSYLWAVTPSSITSHELPKREKIEKAAKRVYDLLTARSQPVKRKPVRPQHQAESQYLDAAATLSQMVLGPVAEQLGTKRLLIVPDGALQYIPFVALPTPRGRRPGSVQGETTGHGQQTSDHQFLIADHEIVSLPSVSALAALRRELAGRPPAAKTVAVFGDPVFSPYDPRVTRNLTGTEPEPNGAAVGVSEQERLRMAAREAGLPGFRRLSGSRKEAQAIVRLVSEERRLAALDFNANRTTAISDQMHQYQIIHFATHGLINSQRPEWSGLVLSLVNEEGRPQNGFLRLHDVYSLKLDAGLVVLSACQTALGTEIKGEGLVGLTRGFMYAGAARVVASLWKVEDEATAELMKRFYESLLERGRRPAAALREAQMSMWQAQKEKWRDPFYWAGFVLQGEYK